MRRKIIIAAAWIACVAGVVSTSAHAQSADASATCTQAAGPGCYQAFELPGGAGRLHFFASMAAGGEGPGPSAALVILHGHGRDADRSFEAGLLAARRAGALSGTLVIAPLFQVPVAEASRCRGGAAPAPQPGDALWTCATWPAGESSSGAASITSIKAIDALVIELTRRWPTLRVVTLAGFSAGAQLLQRQIGFAADPPAGLKLRYVVADPSSWLYFDALRPQPTLAGAAVDWSRCAAADAAQAACGFDFQAPQDASSCPGWNRWKYGTESLPASLARGPAEARARYIAADVHYLEGGLDDGPGPGRAYRLLDKTCAAMTQGPNRLQRGQAYVAYDQAKLATAHPRALIVVPGCAHDAACVLASPEARPALFAP